MSPAQIEQLTLVKKSAILQDVQEYILDCRARNLSPKTTTLYSSELLGFATHLTARGVDTTETVTPRHIRAYLVELSTRRKPAGVHCAYRIIKTFLRWYEVEFEPRGWKNPITKVKAPKTPDVLMEPVDLGDLRAMLATCKRRSFTGDRDRAILLSLLDSGARASEFLALDIGDVNLSTGAVLVRQGKGGKLRSVFLGAKSRRALIRYLRHPGATADGEPLWVTIQGQRLTYWGLRQIVRRRANRAGVPTPALHGFRRSLALLCLRAGVDLVSLQRLLGHASLSVASRYLRQTQEDLRRAHEKGSPVDRL